MPEQVPWPGAPARPEPSRDSGRRCRGAAGGRSATGSVSRTERLSAHSGLRPPLTGITEAENGCVSSGVDGSGPPDNIQVSPTRSSDTRRRIQVQIRRTRTVTENLPANWDEGCPTPAPSRASDSVRPRPAASLRGQRRATAGTVRPERPGLGAVAFDSKEPTNRDRSARIVVMRCTAALKHKEKGPLPTGTKPPSARAA